MPSPSPVPAALLRLLPCSTDVGAPAAPREGAPTLAGDRLDHVDRVHSVSPCFLCSGPSPQLLRSRRPARPSAPAPPAPGSRRHPGGRLGARPHPSPAVAASRRPIPHPQLTPCVSAAFLMRLEMAGVPGRGLFGHDHAGCFSEFAGPLYRGPRAKPPARLFFLTDRTHARSGASPTLAPARRSSTAPSRSGRG